MSVESCAKGEGNTSVTRLMMDKAEVFVEAQQELEVVVDWEETASASSEAVSRTLVGKIVTGKILNKGPVKTILAYTWGETEGLKITDLRPNLYMFCFQTE